MTICEPQSGGEILCLRLSGLGDIVHSMNALSLLKEHRPNAKITWIVEERFADLLENHPFIDELLTIPRGPWERLLKNPLRWPELAGEVTELILELRRHEYDVSLDFQSSLKSAWMVAAADADLAVGFAPPVSRELNYLVQDECVAVPTDGCHRIERNLALLGALAIPTRYARPILPCADRYAAAVEWVCEDLPRPLVLMHPGTSEFASFKRWIPERYGQVAERLMDEHGAGVLVTFGPGEEALAHRLVAASAHRAVLAPRLAHLQQLTYLLGQADLFIGSDTGPMHLASARGVPVVSLFGPKDPVGTGPYCSPSEVVSAPVACRPCTRRRCDNPRCMTEITAEQVYAAAERVLSGEATCRSRPGQTIHAPFSVGFDLGRWRGQICTSYSRPDFFRLVSRIADLSVTATTGGQRTLEGEGFGGGNLLVRSRTVTDRGGRWKIFAGNLRNFWDKAMAMRRRGLPAPFPVCYLCRSGTEVLILEQPPGSCDVRMQTDLRGPEMLIRAAGLMERMHAQGFYHGNLERPGSVAVDDHDRLLLDHLDRSRQMCLPFPFSSLLAGWDLRSFARGCQSSRSTEARKLVLESYCEHSVKHPVSEHILRWAAKLEKAETER